MHSVYLTSRNFWDSTQDIKWNWERKEENKKVFISKKGTCKKNIKCTIHQSLDRIVCPIVHRPAWFWHRNSSLCLKLAVPYLCQSSYLNIGRLQWGMTRHGTWFQSVCTLWSGWWLVWTLKYALECYCHKIMSKLSPFPGMSHLSNCQCHVSAVVILDHCQFWYTTALFRHPTK